MFRELLRCMSYEWSHLSLRSFYEVDAIVIPISQVGNWVPEGLANLPKDT